MGGFPVLLRAPHDHFITQRLRIKLSNRQHDLIVQRLLPENWHFVYFYWPKYDQPLPMLKLIIKVQSLNEASSLDSPSERFGPCAFHHRRFVSRKQTESNLLGSLII
jgi:hypothetical protein